MIEQTVEEVAEAMKADPETWAKMYLELKETSSKLEILVTEHQTKLNTLFQRSKLPL